MRPSQPDPLLMGIVDGGFNCRIAGKHLAAALRSGKGIGAISEQELDSLNVIPMKMSNAVAPPPSGSFGLAPRARRYATSLGCCQAALTIRGLRRTPSSSWFARLKPNRRGLHLRYISRLDLLGPEIGWSLRRVGNRSPAPGPSLNWRGAERRLLPLLRVSQRQ